MKRIILALAAWLAAFTLSSCARPAAQPLRVQIEMTEFAFSPAVVEAKVGQEVMLELTNLGVLDHELMIGRGVKLTGGRPNGYDQDLFTLQGANPKVTAGVPEEADHASGHTMEHTGFMVVVPPDGNTATLTFTVTEEMVGEWEIGCFSQDGVHHDAGMLGQLVVSP